LEGISRCEVRGRRGAGSRRSRRRCRVGVECETR
jgi:hypothetical protein